MNNITMIARDTSFLTGTPEYDWKNISRVIIKRNSEDVHKRNILNDKCNIVFKIAYTLWVLRGSNNLPELSYYADHMEEYTDNFYELRGAYGPRMLFWVGADQLQESINLNMNIDSEEDFTKPDGVNQLERVYLDLQDNNIRSSSIVVMDPAIDFDPTNDVPDLISVTLHKVEGNALNLTMNYSSFNFEGNHLNDIYLMEFILDNMSSWLGMNSGEIIINSTEFINSCIENTKTFLSEADLAPEEKCENSPEAFWENIHKLFFLDRHIRNMLSKKSFMYEDISVPTMADSLERKVIDGISNEYLKNCGYALLVGSIKRYGMNKEGFEKYLLNLLLKMSGPVKRELCEWLLYVGDNIHTVYEECQECINAE